MKKLALHFLLFFLFVSASFARSIPDAPNEVLDPWFQDIQNSWYTSGGYSLLPNDPYLPGNTVDPGRTAGSSVFMRTIVDDFKGLWDPKLHNKEIDFSFFGHLAGDGQIKVRFDWWDDINISQPPLDPNITFNPPPQYSDWYTLTESSLGSFTVRDDLLQTGESLPPGYHIFNLHQIWDTQPRWVSIEIEASVVPDSLGNNNMEPGGEALITGIDFEARCVPEPGAFLLFGFGLLLRFWKKRR